MITIVAPTNALLNLLVAIALLIIHVWLASKVIGRISVQDYRSACLYCGILLLETAAATYLIIPGMPVILVYGYLIVGTILAVCGVIADNTHLLRSAMFSLRYRMAPRSMREYDPDRDGQPRDTRIM